MAIVIQPTDSEQQVPAQCLAPNAPTPPTMEDHRDCPDPFYCTTGRTRAGLKRAMETTYEGALLRRVRR